MILLTMHFFRLTSTSDVFNSDDIASSADVLHMSTHLNIAFVTTHHCLLGRLLRATCHSCMLTTLHWFELS